MLVLLAFIVHAAVNGLGSSSNFYSCITWKIEGYSLELVCRVNDIIYPVYFRDTEGEVVGICNKNEQDCLSLHDFGRIKTNSKTCEVILTIEEIHHKYVNGIWTCVNGENQFHTEVSTSEGIASATDIFIRGERLSSTNKVKITCYSCRQPYRNNVEFLIDDESEDSITFNRETDTCVNGIGVSHPDEFTCDPSGTIFVHIFEVYNKSTGTHFSCDMRFVDTSLSSRFKKKATLYFDGKRFYENDSILEITKHADLRFIEKNQSQRDVYNSYSTSTLRVHDAESSDNYGGAMFLWIFVIVLTAIALFGIAPFCYWVYRNSSKWKKKKEYTKCRKMEETLNDSNVPHDYKETKETVVDETMVQNDESNENQQIDNVIKNNGLHGTKVVPEVRHVLQVDSTKICRPCKTRCTNLSVLAEKWCFDCVEPFCKTCIIYHSSMTVSITHRVVDIQELPENYAIPFLCSLHDQSKLDHYCVQHSEVCCIKCAGDIHINCDTVKTINMILNRFQNTQNVANCKERLCAVLAASQKLNEHCFRNIDEIEKDKTLIQHEICNVYEKINNDIISSQDNDNTIQENKTRLILNLSEKTKKSISDIKEKILELETFLKTIKKQNSLLDFTLEKGSDKETFLVSQYLDSLLSDSERKLETIVESTVCISLRYKQDVNNPLKSLGLIDTIASTPERIDLRHKIIRESQIPVTLNVKHSFLNSELLNVIYLCAISDICISGITVSESGFIIICDREKPRVIVSSTTGDTQTPVDVEFQPWEIDAIPKTDIVVIICTIYDFILFVDALKCSFITKTKIEGSAKCRIACTNNYILIGGMNRIDVLRHKGATAQHVQTITISFSLTSLSLSENDRIIYFSSTGSHKLHRVDMQGKELSSYEVNKSGMQTTIKYLRVDEKNNIYCLDSVGNNVHILSNEGKDLGCLVLGVNAEKPKAFTFNKDCTILYLLQEEAGRTAIRTVSMKH